MILYHGSPVRFLGLPMSAASEPGTSRVHMQIPPFAINKKPLKKWLISKALIADNIDPVQSTLDFDTPRLPQPTWYSAKMNKAPSQ